MATPVILPRQGQSVESCIIGKWNKKVGDTVKVGDILFSYETDKATFEEEAKVEGTMLALFFDEGDDVPCLTNVAVIGNPGESFDEFNPNGGAPSDAPQATSAEPDVLPATTEAEPTVSKILAEATGAAGTAFVSPRAKAASERLKVDAFIAAPTGPHGRVIERDIIRLAQESRIGIGLGGRMPLDNAIQTPEAAPVAPVTTPAAPATSGAEFEDVKLTNIRKIIAKSMQQSLSTMAQLTNNTSFDATNITAFRKQLKAAAEKMSLPNITFNDIILFAVSRVLKNHKDLNAHFLDDKMRYFNHVHLGMAVDTPRGLMVPTLFNADTKSLKEIAFEAKALAKAAQEGNISPDLLTGATFTISNLGTFGIESFTPVINPPQTGILGVNGIMERVRTVNGIITTYPAMGLSLTYDHRAVDGAPASRFLKELSTALENFSTLLIG